MLSKYSLSACLLAALAIYALPALADTPTATELLAEHDAEGQPPSYVQRLGTPYATSTNYVAAAPQSMIATSNNYTAPNNTEDYSTPHKQAELTVSSFYDNDPSSDVMGGSSYGIDSMIYSPTLDNQWRLFAGQMYAREDEPFGEGHINYSRSIAGAEYDKNGIQITGAPTFNDYNGNDRTGAAGDVRWTINDHWETGGGAQLFSRDTPLRALNAGITANSYNLNADYYQDKVRNVRVDADVLTFSDSNVRTILTGSDIEHLYDSSRYTVDGLGTIVESQNSKNEDRPYYNPGTDLEGLVGARVTQPLYQKYNVIYDHHLDVQPGVYWQRDYGSSGAITATYAQHVNYKNDFDGSLGLTFMRQDADGAPENDLSINVALSKKF